MQTRRQTWITGGCFLIFLRNIWSLEKRKFMNSRKDIIKRKKEKKEKDQLRRIIFIFF